MSGYRTCKLCNELKPKSNFAPQGYQCRQCKTEKQRKYYESLPPKTAEQRKKMNEYQRVYRQKNLKKVKEDARVRHLKRKFDMKASEYEEILAAQGGVCAICKNYCATGNSLAVDHDHQTGQIRGLLCKNCNTGLGLFKDDKDLLDSAKLYLINNSYKEVYNGRL